MEMIPARPDTMDRYCWRVIPAFVLLTLFGVYNTTWGQEPPATDVSGTATAAPPETEPGTFSKSIVLPRDHATERDLKTIVGAISSENWPQIAQVLFRLTSTIADDRKRSEGFDLVELDGVVCSTDVAIERVFNRLPATGRAVVLRLVEPIARERLATAVRNQDTGSIRELTQRFRYTQTGQQARNLYRQILRDQGRYGLPQSSDSTQVSSSPADVQVSIPVDEATHETLLLIQRKLRQGGLNPYLTSNLTAAGQTVLISLATARVALDLSTGRVLWTRPLETYGADRYRNPGNLVDPLRARLFSLSIARRAFGEAVVARTVIQQERAFFLEPVEAARPAASGKGDDPLDALDEEDFFSPFPANRLICVNHRTGETLWTQPQDPAHAIFFAGTPQIVDGAVFLLGEARASQMLALYQYDCATGELIDALPVARAAVTIQNDAHRQEIDCQVIVDGDQVFCPTAAGGLFAVDRLTGDVLWANRLARNDVVELPQLEEEAQHRSGFGYWRGWQQNQLIPADGLLVSVSPERDELLVLQADSGQTLWSRAGVDGAKVISASATSGLVVIGTSSATAFDLKTGTLRWTTPISRPAGTGVLRGNDYIFPILAQGLARLNLTNGNVVRDAASHPAFLSGEMNLPTDLRVRNLAAIGDHLIETDSDGARSIRDSTSPDVIASAIPVVQNFAQQKLSGGMPDFKKILPLMATGAEESLHGISPFVRGVVARLLEAPQSGSGSNLSPSLLIDEGASIKDRALARRFSARLAIKGNNLAKFVELWLTAPEAELRTVVTDESEQLRCRLDRWFQAEALVLRQSNLEMLDKVLEEHIAKQITKAESGEQMQFTEKLGLTPWGAKLLLASPGEWKSLRSLVRRQLQWKSLTQHAESKIAAGAAYRLFQLYRTRHAPLDAARWLNVLAAFPPETVLPDNLTVEQVCSDSVASHQMLLDTDPVFAPWPHTTPTTEARPRASQEIFLVPLAVANAAESGFERMNVELDYPLRQAIRFSGATWNRAWYGSLSAKQQRDVFDDYHDNAWGHEQLLIVQTGAALYGMSPVDLQGKLRAAPLWQRLESEPDRLHPHAHRRENVGFENSIQRPGFVTGQFQQIDELGNPLQQVGPVCASYLCYRDQGMLVALETATGEELWRRYDLPTHARIFGDEDHIVIISPDRPEVLICSAVDGRVLSQSERRFHPREIVAAHGLDVIVITGDEVTSGDRRSKSEETPEAVPNKSPETLRPPVTIQRDDLVTGKTLWTRSWRAGTVPFEVDARWMGLFAAGNETELNEIELIDQSTGETISTITIPLDHAVKNIYSCVFETDVLIMLSDKLPESDFAMQKRIRSGYRRPAVVGTLACLDRETGGLRWNLPLAPTELVLDQPAELPVFVTAAYYPPPFAPAEAIEDRKEEKTPDTDEPSAVPDEPVAKNETDPIGVVIRCYDRRTGQLLHELHDPNESLPSYTVLGNRPESFIRIQTLRTRLQINYPRVPE